MGIKMEKFTEMINALDSWLWGLPMIVLLLGTHVFMTLRTGFIQRKTFTGIRLSVTKDPDSPGDVSQFQALTTALASTIGTGNIIGVGTAIYLGGPGAVLWCWLTGVFGIATKYAESLIAVKYRVQTADGRMMGGAMYALERGLKWKKFGKVMAVLFALFTVGTVMFFRYVSGQLYKESVNQLTEICSQLFERLYSQLDVQWQYLDNLSAELIASDDYDEATLSHMLFSRNRMFAPQNDGTLFLALTENGYFYDETGKQGLWSGMDKLDARSRQSHVVSQWMSNDNYMAFVRQIQGNVTVGGENITHVVLLKPIAKMAPYFTSGAFKNKNATYVVDYDGNKMFGDESGVDVNFYGSNLFRALEKLGYPHEKNFGDFLQKSGTDGFVCTDVVADRHHFYLGLKQLQDYDWTMVFLVSADVVATSTRSMTMSMTGIFFVVLSVFVFLSILALCIFSKLNKSKQLLSLKTQTNEQLEQLNEQLTLARRETENALQKANEANKAKSVFLANMSHDIRTPMNAIIGISDIMAHQSDLSAKTQFYVKKLQLSGRHLLGLINDILDMSKIEANEVTLKPEPLCWGDQMRQVVGIIRERAEIRKQNFFVHTHNLVHENVIGDGLRLRKVIINFESRQVYRRGWHNRFRFD